MTHEEQWQTIIKFTAFIILTIAIVFILKTLQGIFVPLVVAIFLAYLFAPAVELLAKIKIPRILTLFILLGIISLAGTFLAQIISNNVKEFIRLWPSLESQLLEGIRLLVKNFFRIETSSIFEFLQSQRIADLLSSFVNRSFSFMGQFLLSLLILIFIYLTYHNYPAIINKAFDEQKATHVFSILSNINEQIIRYILIKTIISAGTGILTGFACAAFNIKFAVLWGFLAFLLNYIPYIGSLVAVIFPITLSVIQFPLSFTPLFAGLSLFAIQLFMGSYLDPEMMGRRFNLSPIVILISLFFWSYVWGIVGAFLAVPITAIIKIVFQNIDSLSFMAVMMSRKAD
jgi:predicted PurR-regulated permease PerM